MRFHLFGRRPESRRQRADRHHPPPGRAEAVDLEEWQEAAAGQRSGTDLAQPASPDGVDTLRDKLLAVLADDEASMVPPSAGEMTQQEWEALSEQERDGFRRLQLKQVDPRLVPHATLNTRRPSRVARVY